MTLLIEEFNLLAGKSIQEHKKRFYLYSNKLTLLDDSERQHIISNLKAEHRQEEIFLTELLLRFEKIDKIKQLILQGDRILNKLIGSHKPFALRDEDVNYFMTDLFPNVSYVVRHKCLNNLTKTITRDDVGEEFFKRVLERYGIKTAQILLPVCSEIFIREIITHYRVILRERQLVTLHQRFGAEFINFYYTECSKYGLCNQFADQPFFSTYLSTKDIATFCQLLKYGTPKIGKRGFKNFMSHKKEEFLNDPTKYQYLVKLDILYRLLTKEEYRIYFLNLLPQNVNDFSVYTLREAILQLNIKDRGTFLAEAFKQRYGFDLYSKYSKKSDTSNNFINNVSSWLSVEDLMKFGIEGDDTLEYMPPAQSFPLIKERINLTSDINNRCQLVLKLFKSAKKNDDEGALLEALKYFNQRHKNDQSSIRDDVFNYIKDNYKMEKLGADVWQYLHELILTEQMLGENQYYIQDMLREELHYKFVNGLDFVPEFKKLLKAMGAHFFNLPTVNKDLQRWILLHLPETCKEMFSDEEGVKHWPRSFLSVLEVWNKANAKNTISYFKYPDIIELALKHSDDYYYSDIFSNSVFVFNTSDPVELKIQNEIIDKYLYKFALHEGLWRWLLKNRVEIVLKHIDLFFEKCCSVYHVKWFLYELHKMHYTPLPGIVREKSLQFLKDSIKSFEIKDDWNKNNLNQMHLALLALSYEKDFMQLINNDRFYPTGEAEVDILDESFKETLRLREEVVGCLRYHSCPQEVMHMLLRFCFKDYFRAALPVLTVVLYNLPERDLVKPLKILQDRSVSVRKRALFFSTTLGSAQTRWDFLKYAGENEKNKSLQKFVFNRTFKNFCCVGSESSFELLMDHFKFVFEKDFETHRMVFQFNLIPRTYLARYIEKVWHFIGKQWENQHTRVLNAITANTMTLLPDQLCDDIIHFSLVHSKEQSVSSDVDFIYYYLLYSGEKIDHRFDLVTNNARLFADEDSQLDFKEFNKKSRSICFLYQDICRRLLYKDEDESAHLSEKKILVNKLAEAFSNLPLPYSHLDYKLQIEVCKCFLEDADKLPELFIKLQNDVLEQHGALMLEYFNEFATSQMDLISCEDEYRISFVQKMLEKNNLTTVKLLAIELLPSDYPCSNVLALRFRNLIEKIEADSAPVVSLYLNRYLKNLNL